MSRLSELITKLCPNGVPHRLLKEVAEYSGTRIDANKLDGANFVGVDNLLSNRAGRTDATYLPNTARVTMYQAGDILLGNIRPYLKKVWLADRVGGCSGDVLAVHLVGKWCSLIVPKFFYFLLSSDNFFAYNMQHAKGAKMPRGNKEAILDFRIPVPPLEVQREIVRILEQFTQLEAELETELVAELEARRRQYEHYRQEALLFGSEVRSRPLGELAKNMDSQRRPVTRSARIPGDIPYYGASGIVDYVSEHIFEGDYLLVSEDGANLLARSSPIAFSITGKSWVNNHAHVLRFNTYEERRFVEIYLNSIDLAPFITGAAQPKLNKGSLNGIPIPDPSIMDKKRIVDVLDKFDALVNDLNISLPAELAARRRQYEYYRDRLLTFKDAAA